MIVMRATVLKVDDLSKEYPSSAGPVRVLDNVSFELKSGQRMIVMGPSGSGKSTLLSILGVLEDPTKGHVSLDGVDPFDAVPAGRAEYRNNQIGFVFQEHHLMAGCSALDNVVLPALATGVVTQKIETRGRELLKQVGLSDRMTHTPAQLSGGERQRVAVARALINRPRLILADEPTGQLDASTAATISDLLVELACETGALLIVVTHSQSISARLGCSDESTVCQLVNGRLEPPAVGLASS